MPTFTSKTYIYICFHVIVKSYNSLAIDWLVQSLYIFIIPVFNVVVKHLVNLIYWFDCIICTYLLHYLYIIIVFYRRLVKSHVSTMGISNLFNRVQSLDTLRENTIFTDQALQKQLWSIWFMMDRTIWEPSLDRCCIPRKIMYVVIYKQTMTFCWLLLVYLIVTQSIWNL